MVLDTGQRRAIPGEEWTSHEWEPAEESHADHFRLAFNAIWRFRAIQMPLYPHRSATGVAFSQRRPWDAAVQDLLSSWMGDAQQLSREYVESLSHIDVVRQVLLVESEEAIELWTIIDAPPFEDAVRDPIYAAQLQIMRKLRANVLVDFRVVNVAELPEGEALSRMVPAEAQVLWQAEDGDQNVPHRQG